MFQNVPENVLKCPKNDLEHHKNVLECPNYVLERLRKGWKIVEKCFRTSYIKYVEEMF